VGVGTALAAGTDEVVVVKLCVIGGGSVRVGYFGCIGRGGSGRCNVREVVDSLNMLRHGWALGVGPFD